MDRKGWEFFTATNKKGLQLLSRIKHNPTPSPPSQCWSTRILQWFGVRTTLVWGGRGVSNGSYPRILILDVTKYDNKSNFLNYFVHDCNHGQKGLIIFYSDEQIRTTTTFAHQTQPHPLPPRVNVGQRAYYNDLVFEQHWFGGGRGVSNGSYPRILILDVTKYDNKSNFLNYFVHDCSL